MSANNLIKVGQLDPSISGYIAGILASNFPTYAALFSAGTGYLGDHVLYITGGDQTILGEKTFDVSPNVPYDVESGQAVSRLFVTNSITGLQALLDEIAPNYVSKVGNQSISGVKTFAYQIRSESGQFNQECLVPFPTTPSGAINLQYLSTIGVVNLSGDQSVSGKKTFLSPVGVASAVDTGDAVNLFQLQQATGEIGASVATYDSRLNYLETSGSSGFAGILSINGYSGRAYLRGCGGITVTQEGSVTRISGRSDSTSVSTKSAIIQSTALTSGATSQFISFGSPFATAPVVVGDLVNSGGSVLNTAYISGISTTGFYLYFNGSLNGTGYRFNSIASLADTSLGTMWKKTPFASGQSQKFISFDTPFTNTPIVLGSFENNAGEAMVSHVLSGVTKSGFYVITSAAVTSNNYVFNSFASSGLGTLGVQVVSIPGEQGPMGPFMTYRGEWQPNVTYAHLDYVLYGTASFLAAKTHLSSLSNNPAVSREYWNIAMSGNGPSGERGPSGLQGIQGPKGDGGILFNWKGQWQPARSYVNGDAVYLSGSAYGMTGAGTVVGYAQSPLNNNAWSLVVNGTGIETADFYPSSTNPSGYVSKSFVQTGLSGFYAGVNHQHPSYITGIRVGSENLSGLAFFYGAGGVSVVKVGDSIMFSGNGLGGGSSSYGFQWRGEWNAADVYTSGQAVEWDNAAYFYTGTGALQGAQYNPLSINSKWDMFEERDLTFHKGDFDPNKIYYKNDLVHYSDAETKSSVVYINTNPYNAPLLNLNPFTNHYNTFEDCDGLIGANLMEITSGVKSVSHPLSGSGSANTYRINGRAPNSQYSGYGTITLIRGESYFFDSEITGHKFILTSSPVGGSFAGEYINNCASGSRLEADGASYIPVVGGMGLESGTLRFTPDATTPDTLYFQSALYPYMGWKLRVVDENPWAVFVSGAIGAQGPQGERGGNGLAFAWKGEWDNATFYEPYDAVYHNGSSWATLESVNALPPSEQSPAWVLVAKAGEDGAKGDKGDPGLAFTWKGNWNSTTIYAPYDSVYYDGSSYGTQVTNQGKNPKQFNLTWTLLAKSGTKGDKGDDGAAGLALGWKGEWSASKTYHSGDAVYYEGSSYGTFQTVVATPPPLAPWFITAQRGGTIFHWAGDWASGRQYYAGDAVFFSGSSYATYASVSGAKPSEGGTWFLCALKGGDGATGPQGVTGDPGLRWRNDWSNTATYKSGDAVYYNGQSYVCISGHTNVLPAFNPPWTLLAKKGDPTPLFSYEGSYNVAADYNGYSMVFYEGSSYACTSDVSPGMIPGVDPIWEPIALGTDINKILRTTGNQSVSGVKTFAGSVRGLSLSGMTNFDWSSGNMFRVSVANSPVNVTFSNTPTTSQKVNVVVSFYGTGTVNFPTTKWAGGIIPIFPTGNNVHHLLEFWKVDSDLFGMYSLNHF